MPSGQALPLQNVTAWHAPLGWPFPPHPLLARRQKSQSVVAAWEMNFCPTQMVTSRQQGPHSGGCPSSCHLTPVIPASCTLDPPGISPCRTAFTGSVPGNEAKKQSWGQGASREQMVPLVPIWGMLHSTATHGLKSCQKPRSLMLAHWV